MAVDPVNRPLPRPAWWAVAAGVMVVLVASAWWLRLGTPQEPSEPSRPPAKYVENAVCLGCHEDEAREWRDSHHALAMAAPNAATVRGDFQDRTFVHRGVTSRFFKRGDDFFVNTDGPDGKLADFQIKYTFGVDPLQQYLIEMPGGRLQPLGIAWDSPKKRWFHLLPNENLPPGDILHWTGRYQTANTMCIVCHTTHFEKGYDPATDTFQSRWTEPNVSCQACHGPGDRHVHYETALRGAGPPIPTVKSEPRGLTVDIRGAEARRRTELCAPCHSRRSELTASPLPGEPVFDHYLPSLLVPGLYHPDGQQLDEVYVDASFRQSLMFERGVTCTNCHNPHTGKLKEPGDGVCLQCHKADPNPSFPSAAGTFDSPAHHFHKAGSTGASCVGCHMPRTTYMQIQQRPDHSIRIPRPDLSVKIGTPDACTRCHVGKNAQWSAAAVVKWYGPVRKQGRHYGEAFAAARAGEASGAEAVAALLGRLDLPPIVRASALAELRHEPSIGAEARMKATLSPDPELRTAAADSAEGLSVSQRLEVLAPLLTDPVRAVRITAARSLSSLPPDQFKPEVRSAFEAALAEYIAAQSVALDMPGAHFNLAIVYENTHRRDLAETHYLGVLKIDPDFTAARVNLAQLYSGLGRNGEAERILAEGLRRNPRVGELQYSLGLLLAEEKRLSEAINALAEAARLLPTHAKVNYNYGLALDQAGRKDLAEAALLRAQQLDPEDPATPYALAIFYAQSGRKPQALKWAEQLRTLRPGDPQVQRLIASLWASP